MYQKNITYAQTLVPTTSNGSIELDDMGLNLLMASSESSLCSKSFQNVPEHFKNVFTATNLSRNVVEFKKRL